MQLNVTCPWISRQLFLFVHPDNFQIELSGSHQMVLYVLDRLDFELFLPEFAGYQGRPKEDRRSILRAFVAKAVLNLPTTRALLDRLSIDPVLRRLMGWERKKDIPSEATFSRAFKEFSESNILESIHEHKIKTTYEHRIIGHVCKDSTAIEAREKPQQKPKILKEKIPKKRGRKPKDAPVAAQEEPKRLAKQLSQTLSEMLKDIPTACDKAGKKDSKGNTHYWNGYKLHLDTADGDVPISAILTSASVHDSQAAIPLSTKSNNRTSSILYELMDSAYDAKEIKDFIISKGSVPIIDPNNRGSKTPRELAPHEKQRYRQRSSAERTNSQLKDNFNARFLRVRGHAKVFTHLMFGVLSLTVIQIGRLLL